jgi:pimeloyl-ACP methyl ester carboxylesterase
MHTIAASGASAPSSTLREHSRQLTVEGIPITLVDQGSGTPTLLLHGLFDSAVWTAFFGTRGRGWIHQFL